MKDALDDLNIPNANPTQENAPVGLNNQDFDLDSIPNAVPKTAQAYLENLNQDPERTAKVMDIAKRLQTPESFVDSYFSDAVKYSKMPDVNFFKELEEQAPKTAQFLLKDKKNIIVAQDDLENLSFFERQIAKAKIGYEQGGLQNQIVELGAPQLYESLITNKAPTINEDKIRAIEDKLSTMPQLKGLNATYFAAQQVPNLAYIGKEALIYGIPGGVVGSALPGIGTAAGFTGLASVGAVKAMIDMEGVSAFREFMKIKGVSPRKAAATALVVGAVNAGLEKFSLDALRKTIPGLDNALKSMQGEIPIFQKLTPGRAVIEAAKKYLTSVAVEGATEGAQEITENVGGISLEGKDGKTGVFDNALDSASAGAQAALVFGSLGTSINVASELGKVKNAEADKQLYLDMQKTAQQSKLKERLPDAYKEYTDEITKDSYVENVYITTEQFTTYFQDKGIDPNAVAKELGIEQEYKNAVETNNDIEVKFSMWEALAGGTEHYGALADDVKFNPNGYTNREKAESAKQLVEKIKAEDEKAQELMKQSEEKKQGYDEVYNYYTQLQAQSGMTDKKLIDFNSQIAAAHAVAESARQGKSVSEWFQGENKPVLNVGGEGQALFQSSPQAPAFYSKLEKTIQDKMPKSAPIAQVRGLLKEIKPEEMQWSGIESFLEGKDKVDKEELINFLQENQVQINEVVKGSIKKEDLRFLDVLEKDSSYFVHFEYNNEIISQDVSKTYAKTKEEAKEIAINDLVNNNSFSNSTTKFEKYTLPGGENYREVLFTLPSKQTNFPKFDNMMQAELDRLYERYTSGNLSQEENPRFQELIKLQKQNREATRKELKNNYKSPHFDEPNILAHTRLNDRTDSEGKKVLFVEEIQSDWHQEGRKVGYRNPQLSAEEEKKLNQEKDVLHKERAAILKQQDSVEKNHKYKEIQDKINEINDKLNWMSAKVPNAPFKKTWHEMVFKRILDQAIRGGYDKIAWTTGDQQAERYDLSKQVKDIQYKANKDKTYSIAVNSIEGREVSLPKENFTASELEGVVGKEIAQKIINGEGKKYRGRDSKILEGVDLKVGGEGMKGFYDKILPEFVNKYTKKWGGKVEETAILKNKESESKVFVQQLDNGKWGVFTKDFRNTTPKLDSEFQTKEKAEEYLKILQPKEIIDKNKIEAHSLTITPPMREAILNEGQTLFQDKLASITFNNNQSVINLFKSANQSSFMHESAHMWLRDMFKFVQSGQASEQYLNDWNTLKEWLEISDDQTDFTVDQQEKFARGFEAYLMEGKAPSEGLQSAFDNFKNWLTKIYREIKNLNVELSDPVRGVMDRMLASEQEIAEAQRNADFKAQLNLEGVPESVIKRIDSLRKRARSKAEAILLKEQMSELTEEAKQFLIDERARVTEEITAKVSEQEMYINIQNVNEEFNGDPYAIAEEYINGQISENKKERFDVLAELMGYSSGGELANVIKNTPPLEQAVANEVNAHMAQFADLKDRAAIKEKAIEAIHNNYSIEALLYEEEILKDLIKEETAKAPARKATLERLRDNARIIKAKAKKIISAKTVKQLSRPSVYYTAERNAAIKAVKAYAKGNFEEAANQKRIQTLNHALAIEANKAKKIIDKNISFLEKQTKVKYELLKKETHFNQFANLLRRFGFARKDYVQEFKNESLRDWSTRMSEVTSIVDLPDWILDESKNYDVRDLNVDQLIDVTSSIKNIRKVATFENRAYTFADKVDLDEVASDLLDTQKESGKTGGKAPDSIVEDWTYKLTKTKNSIELSWLKMETLLRRLDKFQLFGKWWSAFYKPFNDAYDKQVTMLVDAGKTLKQIFSTYSLKELRKMRREKIYIEELGTSFTKAEIIAMGLNWGNEINRERLCVGRNWSEAQVKAVLDKYLDKRDWDAIQNILDFINSYWGQISALYEELTGFTPEKVEATPIETKYGVYRGGYYPLKPDPRHVFKGAKEVALDISLAEAANPAWKRMTKNGHTKDRAAYAEYAVSLDLSVIHRHIYDVVHDLAFRKSVIDTNRLIMKKDVQNAIIDAYGMEGLQAFDNWQKEMAGSNPQPSLSNSERIANWARKNTVVASMLTRFSVLFQQFTGFLSTASVDKNFGYKDAAISGKELITSIYATFAKTLQDTDLETFKELEQFVFSKAAAMVDRSNTIDRDIASTAKDLFEDERVRKFFQSSMIFFDKMVVLPTWKHAYARGLEIFNGNESKAVDYANFIIRGSQGSGALKDLPAIMKGKGFQKLFTMFYSYMNNQFNLLYESAVIAKIEKDIPFFLGRALVLLLLPAIFSEILALRVPTDDDDEDQLKFWASKILGYPLGMIPFVRDFSNIIINRALGLQSYGYTTTPVASVVDSGINMFSKWTSDRATTRDALQATTKTASYLLPYPDQFNILFWNILIDVPFNGSKLRPTDFTKIRPAKERGQ